MSATIEDRCESLPTNVLHHGIIVLFDRFIMLWNEHPMPWTNQIKHRLKLKDLDVLMAVVAVGGMGRAAERLHLSQPAISKAIADLEHTLGVRLLDRSRQGVEPTPYGIALINRGTAVFDELRQGVNDIDFLADPTTGELRIGAVEGVASAIVAPLVQRLSAKYPKMTFSIEVGGTA